jgi:hypothetical protein
MMVHGVTLFRILIKMDTLVKFHQKKGFTAPDGSTSATRFQHSPLNGGNYFIVLKNVSKNQREEYIKLERGNTYYLSFWRDLTRGAT